MVLRKIPLSICILAAGCSDPAATETFGDASTSASDSGAPTSTTAAADDSTSSATSMHADDSTSGPMPGTSEGPGSASGVGDGDASASATSSTASGVSDSDASTSDANTTDANTTDAGGTDSGEPVEPDELVFETQLSHGPSNWATSLSFDDAGNLYLLAYADGSSDPLVNYLTRFSNDGGGWTEDWTWTFPTSQGLLMDLAFDENDQPFVVGWRFEDAGAVLAAIDRDSGTTIGEPQTFPVPAGRHSYGYTSAVFDDAGQLVVGGYSSGDDFVSEPVAAQIDPATAVIAWTADFPAALTGIPRDLERGADTIFGIASVESGDNLDAAHAFAIDPDDGVVLETYPLGTIAFPKFDRDAAAGDFVVVGWNTGISYYDDAFNLLWSSDSVLDVGFDVAFGDDGSIYATGYDPSFDSAVVAVDPDGNLLWSDTSPGGTGGFLLVDHHVDTLAVVREVITDPELLDRDLRVRIYEIP